MSLVHSADSPRVLAAIEQRNRRGAERAVPLLLEVNISGEERKHGLPPDGVARCAEQSRPPCHICVDRVNGDIGGSTAVAYAPGAGFRALRDLRDRLRELKLPNVDLDELSMGMSSDFEAAVEEGATIVRVGSALFEGVEGDRPGRAVFQMFGGLSPLQAGRSSQKVL